MPSSGLESGRRRPEVPGAVGLEDGQTQRAGGVGGAPGWGLGRRTDTLPAASEDSPRAGRGCGATSVSQVLCCHCTRVPFTGHCATHRSLGTRLWKTPCRARCLLRWRVIPPPLSLAPSVSSLL